MVNRESKFQKDLMDEIKSLYPGCVILKNDANYIQGFPDWTILYKDKWVVLEAKRGEKEKHQPNQDYYVNKLNGMSYSAFVYPENKEKILNAIQNVFSA